MAVGPASPAPAIVARLEAALAHVPGLTVLRAADLATIQAAAQPTPSVQVLYHGEAGVSPKGGGAICDAEDVWLATVCVRNVRGDLRTGEAAEDEAWPLRLAVAEALMGWSPGEGFARFEKIRSPYRATYVAGRLYWPQAFSTRFLMRSA